MNHPAETTGTNAPHPGCLAVNTKPRVQLYLDVETTRTDLARQAWEIALIRRVVQAETFELVEEHELTIYIRLEDLDLDHGDPESLEVSRFHDRHPAITGDPLEHDQILCSAAEAAALVYEQSVGAEIHGVVPSFDTTTLTGLLVAHRYEPRWKERLVDVTVLGEGVLRMQGITPIPNSDASSRQCGVEPPAARERHTAMGDARWSQRWHQHLLASTTHAHLRLNELPIGASS
jgi:hypothetical protein